MNIQKLVEQWIEVSNDYDIEKYLNQYHKNAVLDDPSVGRSFKMHEGIREYFENYFIDYKTQTSLVDIKVDDNKAYLKVEFTGDFPGNKIGGVFDITFKDDKISHIKADLL
ncbi:nuclear transport factor 2 family protein [Chryseobacterium sp. PBS4-4]|uniref:Nuclear transport factor 2 family protein n=1 Tax=Chryseobacterium edaphi TaxID=2976532 RepID=A0ABT2W1Y4_9FLAO|nr:nuclear transport factor 2 family protein [Chryseobacterium edaphi]MCU7616233.1 nuclear transport factor 2 family protein [Chryseobacterium edaphi]